MTKESETKEGCVDEQQDKLCHLTAWQADGQLSPGRPDTLRPTKAVGSGQVQVIMPLARLSAWL